MTDVMQGVRILEVAEHTFVPPDHGDEILAELCLDWDTVVDLKVRGVIA